MGASTRQSIYKAPPVLLAVMDLPPLFAGNEAVPGVYVAARTGGKKANTGIDGIGTAARVNSNPIIQVYISRDGGTTFTDFVTISNHAAFGSVLATEINILGDVGTYSGYLRYSDGAKMAEGWDRRSKIGIGWEDDYVPASTTKTEVLSGANRLIVGSEIVAFQTIEAIPYSSGFGATDGTADGIYWHSDLMRGRRGTENDIANRAYGDQVIAIAPDSVIFVPILAGDLQKSLVFKAGTPGFDLSDAETIALTPTGRNVLPLPPANASGTRDASNNLTLNWSRRTRSETRTFGVKAWPYGEDTDNYEVEILSTMEPFSVLRTISTSSATATYTAAQAAADGLTAGALVNVRIYQKSNVAGRGDFSTWAIPANSGGAANPTPSAKLFGSRLD